MALGLRIVMDRCVDLDRCVDRHGGGVEISLFFWVIMRWLFLMDVAIVGGFLRLIFFFFLCGGYFLWLWLVVDLVI